jgi:hypothetical protein
MGCQNPVGLESGQSAEIDFTGAGTIRNEELPLTSDDIGSEQAPDHTRRIDEKK